MNPEYYYKSQDITVIATLYVAGINAGPVAYVAIHSPDHPHTDWVNGFMACAMNHHAVLCMFDRWEHADCSYNPAVPCIIVQ